MPDFDCQRLRRTVLRMAYSGSTVHIACAVFFDRNPGRALSQSFAISRQ